MNTCCDYAYWCPTARDVKCYAHGGYEQCCEREELHECLPDMYGSEDGIGFGDGFICLRCGNYEAAGNPHGPPAPGFPRKTGPPRKGTLLDPPPASTCLTSEPLVHIGLAVQKSGPTSVSADDTRATVSPDDPLLLENGLAAVDAGTWGFPEAAAIIAHYNDAKNFEGLRGFSRSLLARADLQKLDGQDDFVAYMGIVADISLRDTVALLADGKSFLKKYPASDMLEGVKVLIEVTNHSVREKSRARDDESGTMIQECQAPIPDST